uniref:Uncharacterized protein n=1 Tax=Anguilla anguilla TaxID=7936 RepID=A0A0E9VRZ7_ANGAN
MKGISQFLDVHSIITCLQMNARSELPTVTNRWKRKPCFIGRKRTTDMRHDTRCPRRGRWGTRRR